MDDLEGFAEWRDVIKSRVSTLEASVGDQVLARAEMREDVGELKIKYGAQKDMLQAISEVQSEHTGTLRNHTVMLQDHTERLMGLEEGQAEMRAGIRTVIKLLDPDPEGDTADGSE